LTYCNCKAINIVGTEISLCPTAVDCKSERRY